MDFFRANDDIEDDERHRRSSSTYDWSTTKQPTRSYRCQTNMTSLQPYKYPPPVDESSTCKGIGNYSLFLFSETNRIRITCRQVVETKYFEYFMLLTIAANCIVLMMASPLPNDDTSNLNQKLEEGDSVFVAVFAIEALLKIVAYGFLFSNNAYLKSGWNVLDFIVVVVGIVQVLTALGNSEATKHSEAIRGLRVVRVLRPLKLVSGVPSLQVLMKSLIRAMVPLLQILLLVLFVIIIYSIIGLELLRGRYRYVCFDEATNKLSASGVKPRPCDFNNGWGRKCEEGTVCKKAPYNVWPGPNNGITSFDNMLLSMLTVLQCITLEGWSEVLYLTMDSLDQQYPILTWSAFILLIVVGSFFMLNLVLGVLSGEFAKERERVENRKSFLKLRKQRQIERQVDHYLNWIGRAEEILTDDENSNDDEGEDEDEKERDDGDASKNNNNSKIENKKTSTERTRKKSRVVPKPLQRRIRDQMCILEKRFRIHIRYLIKSKFFYWLLLLLVFLNTVSMSFNKYNQDEKIINIIEITELVFTTLFFVEMLLRLYGLGVREYFRSSFNKYDFVIVWLSIGDLLYKHILKDGNFGISVLRSVRLLRVFKVTRFWSSMQNVISSLMNSIRSILSLILLLLLFIFIFALLGMQLFGGRFNDDMPANSSRTNFDNFVKAMLAVFQIITGEDWNSIMYRGISAFGGPKSASGMLVSLYFISLVILVDNLANAQVLTKDAEDEAKLAEEQKKLLALLFSPIPTAKPSKWNRVRTVPKMLMFAKKNDGDDDTTENPFKGMTYKGRSQQVLRAQSEPSGEATTGSDFLHKTVLKAQMMKYRSLDLPNSSPAFKMKNLPYQHSFDSVLTPTILTSVHRLSKQMESRVSIDTPPPIATEKIRERKKPVSKLPIHLLPFPSNEFPFNSKILRRRQLTGTKVINARSLMIFTPSSRIRTGCHNLVNMNHFEHIMLAFIILSSICLAIEDPLSNDSKRNKVLYYTDIGFVTIFMFEIIVKLIDQGAFWHKGSYLRDWWNVIDTIVVACNVGATVLMFNQNEDIKGAIGQSTLQALRILRVFRPLRVVNKIKSLKLVFQCVVFSLKRVLNIIIIVILILFMFAVIGVNLFKGKFQYCNDKSKLTNAECQGEYFTFSGETNQPQAIKIEPRVWQNYDFNFDDVGQAMLTLLSCGTGEGWPIVMEKSIDATEIDKGPISDNKTFMCFYYVCFVIIFSFFFLNIFVALIIVTFQEQGEKEITGCEFNKNQRACLQFVLNSKPRQRFMPADKSGFSYKMWCFVDSKPFEIVIMMLIAVNAIILMLSVDEQDEYQVFILENINFAFTFLFTFEASLKLMAYKMNYFRDGWNVLDFFIVFVTLVGSIIKITNENFPIDPSFFRLFRAFRLLKLLRQGYNIRILLWTFLQSLRALPYVALLIGMLFFIYAVIGMQLFSKIALNETRYINEYNNFQSFLKSLAVLFRCGTGEAWHLVMLNCFDQAPCLNDNTKQCGSSVAAILYFCTFYFFYAFLLLNLFVAVIMDNFDYLTRDESILGPHHMDEFVRVWSEYDPSALGRISHEHIYQLMCDMQPPVGFGKKCPRFLAYKRLMKLNMPISGDNTVSFTPTLFALVRTSLGITYHENECFRDSSLRKIIKRVWPNTTQKTLEMLMPEQTVLSGQQITIGKIYAAKLIYESFKEIKRRKNCTLPQFEMFEAQHKRGSSFFRKMMGVLRTTSQPLTPSEKHIRPREEYLNIRRRSNTLGCKPLSLENIDDIKRRSRSTANIAAAPTETFSSRIRKMTLPAHQNEQYIQQLKQDSFESTRSLEIISNSSAGTEKHESNSIKITESNQPTLEQNIDRRQSLTDTLLTALRDPAKPILCFVNPQIHRENKLDASNESHISSQSNRDCKKSIPRMRQKRVTVSLPMIRLEIPVESNSDFMDIGQSHSRQSSADNTETNVPDLISSVQQSNNSIRTRLPENNPDNILNPSILSRDDDTDGEWDVVNADDNPERNRDYLFQLNTHLNKAMSTGVQPRWIYQIDEAADTWC